MQFDFEQDSQTRIISPPPRGLQNQPPDPHAVRLTVSAAALRDALRRTEHCMLREASDYLRPFGLMKFSSQKMELITTDGHRLAWFDLPANCEHTMARTVGRETWEALASGYGRGEMTISTPATDAGPLRFEAPGLRIDAPEEYGFPENTERVVDSSQHSCKSTADRSLLLDAVAQCMRKSEKKVVYLEAAHDGIQLYVPAVEFSIIKPARVRGRSAVHAFNAEYLTDALHAAPDEKVILHLKPPNSRKHSLILTSGCGSMRETIMPVRLDEIDAWKMNDARARTS